MYLEYVIGIFHLFWICRWCQPWLSKLASAAWVKFTHDNQFLSSGGSFIGPVTNNVVEYNTSIELLIEANTLGIQQIIVKLDSQLVISHSNGQYQDQNSILFRKFLRVHLLELQFEVTKYIHVPKFK